MHHVARDETTGVRGELMAKCPYCGEKVRPVRDESATPKGTGDGISGSTWICPECETILGVSEVTVL